jgi:hypothetical protein
MHERDALAIYGLKKMVVDYAHNLYYLIDRGASAEALQIAVENFEANCGIEVRSTGWWRAAVSAATTVTST